MSRGAFLTGAVAAVGSMAVSPAPTLAATATDVYRVRQLWIVDAHTGRELRAYLTIDGVHLWRGTAQYPGYDDICYLLRDTHQGIEAPINFVLLEAAYETQQVLYRWGYRKPIVVTSGYRTVETNSAVGGARYSYHMRGEAIDLYVPDTPLEVVWQAAGSRSYTGGMGWYPQSHVHLDVGPRRYWVG